MKKNLVFVCAVLCLTLFISASVADYVCAQKTITTSLFEQTCDDSEEKENSSNEKEGSELEDEFNSKPLSFDSFLITIKMFDHKKIATHNLVNNYFLEVTSPPPQA
jgi:hypothetical protein